MTVNLSNSLGALSLLTGSSLSDLGYDTTTTTVESKAVRLAKAQFTTVATTPPWKEAASTLPESSQVAAIKAMKTIIDSAATGVDALPNDVQTTFTAYKALDRLQLLAQTAAASTTGSATRATLQKTFAKGLADLQSYLATAPSDKVELDFGTPTRRAESVKVTTPDAYEKQFTGIVSTRDAALPGLTGTEKFQITLSKPGATADVVTVDLSTGPQPPTLDSMVDAMNAAIKAIPAKNADGTVQTNTDGSVKSRWLSSFEAVKNGDKWGFQLDTPSGVERVAIDQVDAPDALMVASGQTALDAPTATKVFRFDDPTGAMSRKTLATISGYDAAASAAKALLPDDGTTKITATSTAASGATESRDIALTTDDVYANTDAKGIVTDAQGFSYVVGTTSGDLDTHKIAGSQDLFLTKMDSEGKVVWQRELGASGSAQGAAISLAADGSVVVAGTINGSFDGATTDGDMLVARFSASGDEKFSTVVRQYGADQANAVAVGSDGSIYVGGKSAQGSDAFLARIDSSGKLAERRVIADAGNESVTSLAIGSDGNVVALVNNDGVAQVRKFQAGALATDLGSIDLGSMDARALAVGADGTIAVGGAVTSGTNRDGFVSRIDAGLTSASTTMLATTGDDQVDSVTFLDGQIYAGGRTTGALGSARTGAVDGFVSRIDAGTGAVASTTQFGSTALRTEPVRVSAAAGGASVLGSLGLNRGTLNPETSTLLTTQTNLRAGDEFSIAVAGGTAKKITIKADDTLASLATRIRAVTGVNATVTTPTIDGATTLRIEAKTNSKVELIAGAAGKDALDKLGIEPQRLSIPYVAGTYDPKVSPGGTFGLDLSEGLNISTAADASAALKKISSAVSMSQTAYRSLYWDDAKAKLADGTTSTSTNAQISKQLANYQAALSRLTSTSTSSTTSTLLGY